jgi:hypothetical protein
MMMSNKITIVLSINSDNVSRFLFDDYVNACADADLVVRYEPYTSDIYAELNDKALDIEKREALASLEEEILNSIPCVGGNCED